MQTVLVDDTEEDQSMPKPRLAITASIPPPASVFLVFWIQTHIMCQSRLKSVSMRLTDQLQKISGLQLRFWNSLPRHLQFNFPLLNKRSTRQQKLQRMQWLAQAHQQKMTRLTPTQASQIHTPAGWWKKYHQPLWTTEQHHWVSSLQGWFCLLWFNWVINCPCCFFHSLLLCKVDAPEMVAQPLVSLYASTYYVNGGF